MYYLNMYFIGAFIGFFFETFLKKYLFKSMNNGILYGPWIPLYGFGILLLFVVVNFVSKLNIKKKYRLYLSILLLFLFITILEEFGGVFIKVAFNKTFWSYKKLMFNIGPFISIEMSLLWTCLLFIFVFYIKPGIDLFIKKIPNWVSFTILGIHIVDIIFTLLM